MRVSNIETTGVRVRGVGAVLIGLAVIAASCSSSSSKNADTTVTTAPSATTVAPPATTIADTTVAPTTTASATGKPVVGGELIVGIEAETASAWTPAKIQCAASCYVVLTSMIETLAGRNTDGVIEGLLAESIVPNADYTVWTVTIRPNITFHDGTALDAAAVVDNMKRAAAGFLTQRAVADIAGTATDPAIVATGPMTVQITLKRSWVDFPVYLTSQLGMVASPKWLAAADSDQSLESKPVGTGPFMFESYSPGDKLVAVRNPNYWRTDADGTRLPYLDKVTFRVIPDVLQRAEALRSGNVDILHTTSNADIAKFRTEPDKFPMYEQPDLGETNYLLMQVGKENSPLNDLRVRCGLAAASDTASWIEAADGTGVVRQANGPFSPGQPGYLDDNGNQKFDLAKAKELIAAYEKEKGPIKLILTIVPDAVTKTTAQIVQAQWKDAGVDVEIKELEQGQLILNALLGADDFDVFGWRAHSGSQTDQQYVWWHSSNALPKGQLALNFGRMRDPVIDGLLDKNRGEADPAVKAKLAQDINREFAKQCWIIPSSWTLWAIPHTPSVHGLDDVTLPSGKKLSFGSGYFPVGALWKSN